MRLIEAFRSILAQVPGGSISFGFPTLPTLDEMPGHCVPLASWGLLASGEHKELGISRNHPDQVQRRVGAVLGETRLRCRLAEGPASGGSEL